MTAAFVVAGGLFLSTVAVSDDMHKGQSSSKSPMKMMDRDGDGAVSSAEHAEHTQKMFEKMDIDQDGKVTATEMDSSRKDMAHTRGSKPMKSSAEKIKMMDTDNDGAMSAAEHTAGARKMFERTDADKDGSITAAEVGAQHEKMKTHEGCR